MSRGDAYRPGRHVALVAGVCAAALFGVSCARKGPPAPLDDRTGIYYASPAQPKTASVERVSAPTGPVAVAPAPSRSATITSSELPPSSAPAARTVERARPVEPPSVESAQPAPLPASGTLITTNGGTVKVRTGDTLFAISRRENIPIRALIDANRLKPPYGLAPGQTLRVPGLRIYTVAAGDTVYGVARRFDAGINDLVRQNELKAPDFALFIGQKLVMPLDENAVASAPGPAAREGARAGAPPTQTALRSPQGLPEAGPVGDPDADPPPRAGAKFLWPLRGRIVSTFGAKGGGLYNDGINIAAKPGEVVRAAENGVVAYAGNELRGYGNLLLVRHSGGWISAYAHNGELMVRRGQVVKRGQPIARVGSSGAVAAPQLHFELRRGRKAVDPRPYLG